MCARVAVIFNKPVRSRYDAAGEHKAISGVMDAVNAVKKSLVELHHNVTLVPLELPIVQASSIVDQLNIDVVFNLFEGFPGYPETEAWLPDLLLRKGVFFTGCPGDALRLGLNKPKTKDLLRAEGVLTPSYQLLTADTTDNFQLKFPCIVKPMAEDASHGLSEDSVVGDTDSLRRQVVFTVAHYGGKALVEEFIDGREFNATVIGNSNCSVLPVSEIIYSLPVEKPRILTFAAKWDENHVYYKNTPVICPAEIDPSEQRAISQVALKAFHITGCRGYARVDMRLDRNDNINVIEVNPNPDISPDTGAARQAKAAGITYTEFIAKILSLATADEDVPPLMEEAL